DDFPRSDACVSPSRGESVATRSTTFPESGAFTVTGSVVASFPGSRATTACDARTGPEGPAIASVSVDGDARAFPRVTIFTCTAADFPSGATEVVTGPICRSGSASTTVASAQPNGPLHCTVGTPHVRPTQANAVRSPIVACWSAISLIAD